MPVLQRGGQEYEVLSHVPEPNTYKGISGVLPSIPTHSGRCHGFRIGRASMPLAASSFKKRSAFGSQRRSRPRRKLMLPRWAMVMERCACSMGAIGSCAREHAVNEVPKVVFAAIEADFRWPRFVVEQRHRTGLHPAAVDPNPAIGALERHSAAHPVWKPSGPLRFHSARRRRNP